MTVKGIAEQATSPTMPTLITCASIWPKPATSAGGVAVGDEDAGGPQHRVDDVAGRSANCWTMPSMPATTRVLSSATCASRERGLGARLLRGQLEVDLRLDRRLAGDRGVDGALLRCRPATCARSTSRCGDGVWRCAASARPGCGTRRGPAAARRGPGRSGRRPRRAATRRRPSSASTSAILRRAVSIAASCSVLSSRNSGWPGATRWLMSTKVSATRPSVSGRMVTVRNTETALEVEGWK